MMKKLIWGAMLIVVMSGFVVQASELRFPTKELPPPPPSKFENIMPPSQEQLGKEDLWLDFAEPPRERIKLPSRESEKTSRGWSWEKDEESSIFDEQESEETPSTESFSFGEWEPKKTVATTSEAPQRSVGERLGEKAGDLVIDTVGQVINEGIGIGGSLIKSEIEARNNPEVIAARERARKEAQEAQEAKEALKKAEKDAKREEIATEEEGKAQDHTRILNDIQAIYEKLVENLKMQKEAKKDKDKKARDKLKKKEKRFRGEAKQLVSDLKELERTRIAFSEAGKLANRAAKERQRATNRLDYEVRQFIKNPGRYKP